MQVKLKFHGFLKELFSEKSYDVKTPAEAIKAWSIQNRDKLKDKPLLSVKEASTEHLLYSNLQTEELNIYPTVIGAKGGGGIIKIIVGAVLIAAGVLVTPFSPMLGTALISLGASMVIGGVLEMLSPVPKLNANLGFDMSPSNDDRRSNYLGAPGNTTKIGTPIPIGYGRFKLSGQFLSYNVNATDIV